MKRDLVKGAAGGAFATAVMSVVMLAGTRAGLMPDQPPKRIARAFLPGYKHRPKQGEGVLGAVTHFGFGSGCGALLALASGGAASRWRSARPTGWRSGSSATRAGCRVSASCRRSPATGRDARR